jgi:fructokinase
VPVVVETDVGAAAWAEKLYGAGRAVDSLLYVTVGTGIGAALYYRDHIFMTAVHPEMGHVVVRRHPDDRFPGTCPAHGDCLEGLACGKALEARWGARPAELPDTHAAWLFEAYYLAQAVTTYVYMTEPDRIVLGGGVMQRPGLLARVQATVPDLLRGYHMPPRFWPVDQYVVAPELGREAGVRGALWLAARLLRGDVARP